MQTRWIECCLPADRTVTLDNVARALTSSAIIETADRLLVMATLA